MDELFDQLLGKIDNFLLHCDDPDYDLHEILLDLVNIVRILRGSNRKLWRKVMGETRYNHHRRRYNAPASETDNSSSQENT